jgi:hypothetical protein
MVSLVHLTHAYCLQIQVDDVGEAHVQLQEGGS